MDVLQLNSTNFAGLSTVYPYDSTLRTTSREFTTYDGLTVSVSNLLSSVKDSSVNYHSNFILSDLSDCNNFISLSAPLQPYPYNLTTYFGLYSVDDVVDNTLVIATSATYITPGAFKIGSSTYSTSTNAIFDVEFIDKSTCTVQQTIDGVNYYLSYFLPNTDTNTFLMLSSYLDNDVNLFDYIYDDTQQQLLLMKTIFGVKKYVTYDFVGNYLTMCDFLSGSEGILANTPFRLRQLNALDLTIPVSWYSYAKNVDATGLQVNSDRCVDNLSLNYLFNLTNCKISNNSIPVNLLPLKNDFDDRNTLSRGSIMNQDVQGVLHRNYTSLNTGTNQIKGSADFNNTYNSFTSRLTIKPDNTTFFYFPYDTFPVVKLNINDSTLVNSGAIAGDSPLNSDKVFKRKILEQFSKPFNTNQSEQTGTYLCSWLKGGESLSALPVWYDRYYNPQIINSIGALQYNNTPNYLTEFKQLSSNSDNTLNPVYDITSNLTFEAGYQYAYQRIGQNNVAALVDSLSATHVVKWVDNVYDTLNQKSTYIGNEIVYGSGKYSKILNSSEISKINEFDNFTITFDLKVDDWSTPIGYQLFGNYNQQGFGIFNYQHVTPFVISYDGSVVSIFNTDLKLLDIVDVDGNVVYLSKLDPVGNIIAVTDIDEIVRVSYNSTITDKQYVDGISQAKCFYTTLETTYFFDKNYTLYEINNSSLDVVQSTIQVQAITNNLPSNPSYISLFKYQGNLYQINGNNVKYQNDKIYFTSYLGDVESVNVYDFTTGTNIALQIYNCWQINDYVILEDDTLYVLYGDVDILKADQYYRIDNANSFPVLGLFSNQPSLSASQIMSFDYIQNFNSTGITDTGFCFVLKNPNGTKSLVRTNLFETGTDVVIQNSYDLPEYVNDNFNVTNYSFAVSELTKQGELEFRFALPNVYDKTDNVLLRCIYDCSKLQSGYHTFSFRFDSVNGVYTIFVDGSKISETLVESGQYSFSSAINQEMFIGNTVYYNNEGLSNYIQKLGYYFTDQFYLRNLYIYNSALYYYDLLLHNKLDFTISNLYFELPTGKRNFVETVQQFFKFKVPGFKSNFFEVVVSDLPITGDLKTSVDTNFDQIISTNKPVYTENYQLKYE